ncbi:uncharacterized protein LOC144073322 [Stigmatopora argus]
MGQNFSWTQVQIRKVTVVQWQRQWVRTSGGLKFKSGKSLWSSGKDNGSELQVDSSSNQESCCGPVVKTMGQNFSWTQVQIRKVTVVQWQRQWVRTSGGLKFKSGKSLWSSGKDNGSELQVDSSSNQESCCGPVVKTMGQNFSWTQVQIRKVTVVQW